MYLLNFLIFSLIPPANIANNVEKYNLSKILCLISIKKKKKPLETKAIYFECRQYK